MKFIALLFLLFCVFWTATSNDVQKTEQKNRFGLVNQRIRSLRDSLGGMWATDTTTPKPVAAVGNEDDEDQWDIGTFLGQLGTKVGLVVKNAVKDLLECVDNVFNLSPGEKKKETNNNKDNKGGAGAASANSTLKPTESTTVGSTTVNPTESTTAGGTGNATTSNVA